MQNFYTSLFELIEMWYPLEEGTKRLIVEKSQVRRVKRTDYLFQEGQDGTSMFFVVQGGVRGFVLDNEFKEHVVRFGFENRMVGDIRAFLYGTRSELNLQAIENAILLEVSSCNLKELFVGSNTLSLFYKDFLEYELSIAQDRIINQLSKKAEDRYLSFLKEFGKYNNRIPDKYIASYIGVTPEFFSKLKKKVIREFLNLG